MRFSEIYDTLINVYTKDNYKKIDNLSNLGAFSYPTPITDKENINTPHYIMDRCLSMASEEPIVSSAVEQVIMFIFPQKKLSESKSKKTEKWLNKWLKLRPDISEEMYKILFTNVATGNRIMQYVYNKEGKLDNVYALNDVSRNILQPGPQKQRRRIRIRNTTNSERILLRRKTTKTRILQREIRERGRILRETSIRDTSKWRKNGEIQDWLEQGRILRKVKPSELLRRRQHHERNHEQLGYNK